MAYQNLTHSTPPPPQRELGRGRGQQILVIFQFGIFQKCEWQPCILLQFAIFQRKINVPIRFRTVKTSKYQIFSQLQKILFFLLWVTKTPLPLSSSRPTWRYEYKRLLESLYFNRLQLCLIIQRWILVPLILNVVFCMGVSSHPFMRGDQRQFDFLF